QGGDEVVRLEDEADLVASNDRELLLGARGDVDVTEQDATGRHAIEPGEAVQQGRLARAGRAHDRGVPAGGELDGDVVEGTHRRLPESVDLRDLLGPAGDGAGGGVSSDGRRPRAPPAWCSGYRDPTRKEQVRPSLWVDLHLLDELLDAPADLVADGTDGSEPETLGVVEDPVLVVLSRVDRACV